MTCNKLLISVEILCTSSFHSHFPSALQDFANCLKDKNVYSKGFNYFIVAIMGCQSGGKSISFNWFNKTGTLLNYLFGTRFPVMDASEVLL
jgi:hypothetical protein